MYFFGSTDSNVYFDAYISGLNCYRKYEQMYVRDLLKKYETSNFSDYIKLVLNSFLALLSAYADITRSFPFLGCF